MVFWYFGVQVLLLFSTATAQEDPCAGIICDNGTECDFVNSTGEIFCNPTCEDNNGGCGPLEECIQATPACTNPDEPCPRIIQCTDPCDEFDCEDGTVCEVVPSTLEPFCNPSCDDDNGGCPESDVCLETPSVCPRPDIPCENTISCIGPCSTIECNIGEECEVLNATNFPFCNPTCDVGNGGCPSDEVCIETTPSCEDPNVPCMNEVTCQPIFVPLITGSCRTLDCGVGEECLVVDSTNQLYCSPTCRVDNGGCDDSEDCDETVPICINPAVPCPHTVTCGETNYPMEDPCTMISCGIGEECNIVESTNEPFCNPTCSADNGGCANDEICSEEVQGCINPNVPCVNTIFCTPVPTCSPVCSRFLCSKPGRNRCSIPTDLVSKFSGCTRESCVETTCRFCYEAEEAQRGVRVVEVSDGFYCKHRRCKG